MAQRFADDLIVRFAQQPELPLFQMMCLTQLRVKMAFSSVKMTSIYALFSV